MRHSFVFLNTRLFVVTNCSWRFVLHGGKVFWILQICSSCPVGNDWVPKLGSCSLHLCLFKCSNFGLSGQILINGESEFRFSRFDTLDWLDWFGSLTNYSGVYTESDCKIWTISVCFGTFKSLHNRTPASEEESFKKIRYPEKQHRVVNKRNNSTNKWNNSNSMNSAVW